MTKGHVKKALIVLTALVVVGIFFYLDFDRFLTLEYIKESQARFQQLYAEHRFSVIAAYSSIYILVTALSLPGAVVMTLAGGGLFGLGVGSLVISFASTIGATLACFVARTLLRDWVQGKFGDKLATINDGIAREGGFYLFTLRLIPIFPFFMINLVMGLTTIRLSTFFWVSQLGMLPGTIVYVNAGKELAKIDSPAGILSPELLLSFVLLGILPISMKKLLPLLKKRFVRETS